MEMVRTTEKFYIENVIEANLKACLTLHKAAGRAFNIACAGGVKHSNADISEVRKQLEHAPECDSQRGFSG